MKKVLLITHFFPPRPSIGSIRPGGIAKYLPQFGWEPIVLTTTLPSKPKHSCRIIETSYNKDFSYKIKEILGLNPDLRLDQQPKPILIKSGKNSIFPKMMEIIYGILNYPDEMKGWIPFAVKEGKRLISSEKIDAIISSSHPFTTHLIAKNLKVQCSVPWIADLRDLWTQNPYYQYGTIRKFFERTLEIKTFAHADALVTVSQSWADELKKIHKTNKQIETILSGFDPDDIGSAELTKKFTLTYTGRFYDGKRDPSLIFQSFCELFDKRLIDPNDVEIRFWGSKNYWLEKEIQNFKLESIAHQYGMIPREESIIRQRESQILLMLSWNNPVDKGTYTGKIYEYLAAQRPILAIGHTGVVSDLLLKTNAGFHASNTTALKNKLLEYYQEYKKSGQVRYNGNWLEVNQYSQIEMAKKYSELLNKIIL